MGKYHDAADVLKRSASKYKSLMDAAAALDEVGSLDQAAEEAKKAAEAARAEILQVQSELGASKDELKEHKAKVAALKKADQAKADELMQSAQDDAKAIIDAANATAAQIKADAQLNIESLLAQGRAGQAELGRVVEEQKATLQQIEQAKEAKLKEIVDLESRLSKVQANIARLLG